MPANSPAPRFSAFLLLVLPALAACSLPTPAADKCDTATPCTKVGYTCDIPSGYCVGNCGKHACLVSEHCSGDTDANKVCVPNDTIQLTAPVKDQVIGLLPVTVSAKTDSSSVIEVDFAITQAASSASSKPAGVTTGNNGVYTRQVPMKGDAAVTGTFVSGQATVVATLQYKSAAGVVQTPKSTDPISVTIDADGPAVTAPSTDKAFYSSIATPAQTAVVTVQVNDVGAAGMDATTVNLTANGQTYPPDTQPTGGAGAYTFKVPVANLGAAANFQGTVPFTVNATDKVGNATAFTGGSIPIDNKPPTFSNIVASATAWYGGAATVPLKVDISDPAGGAGLDATTPQLQVVGGSTTKAPSSQSGATFAFSPLGSELQLANTQGNVSVQFSAADTVGNAGTSAPPTVVQVDRKPPAIGTVTIPANPAAGSGGWYKRDLTTTVAATVVVDDGAGSGAASATLSSGAFTQTSTTATSTTGTQLTYTIQLPVSIGAVNAEAPVSPGVGAADAAGNSASGTTAAVLKVDGLGPTITNITAATTADYAAPDTTKYYNQSVSTPIEVDATIVDNGSGVNLNSLKLMNNTAQVDTPNTVTAAAGGVYKFFIARSNGPVAAGQSGTISFSVVASDNVGNSSSQAQPGTLKLAIDGQAPTVNNQSTDKNFYSSVAAPPQTAVVSVTVNEVGPSGIDTTKVNLTVPGHSYNPATIPPGGNGVYTFAVPVGDLNEPAGFQGNVGYTVNALDNAKNSTAFTTGTIPIDNKPPTFTNYITPSGFLGGAATVNLSVDITDPVGGAGLSSPSVKLSVVGGANPPISPAGSSGATYNFTPLGSDLQATNTQGAVPLKYAASDAVGNANTDTTQSVKIDLAAPTIGALNISQVTQNTAVYSNGWYSYDASGTAKVAATIIIDDGTAGCTVGTTCGSGAASATIAIGSFTPAANTTPSASNVGTSGQGNQYTFNIPTSVGTSGQEVQLNPTTVSGADVVGNSANGALTATLKIDNKGPTISNVTLVTAGVDVGGTSWFSQTGGAIEVDATIVDNGSGVDKTTLKLMNGGTRVDDGTVNASTPVANVYKFFIVRSGTQGPGVPVGTGQQGVVSFNVVAADNLVNSTSQASGINMGIDGQPPDVSLSSTWTSSPPVLNAGAAASYPGGDCPGDFTVNDVCGHDGGHYWRKGETNPLPFYANDRTGGSGVSTAIASVTACSIGGGAGCNGLAYVSTDGNQTLKFTVVPDFSTATFSSAADGTANINFAVTVQDAVGNSTALPAVAVGVTRLKWIRKLGTKVDTFKGSPIVTTQPANRILLGGIEHDALGPIVGLAPDGSLQLRAGHAQLSALTNMAYSSTTNNLYFAAEGGTTLFALHVNGTGTGVDASASAAVLTGATGAPAIVPGTAGKEYTLISDSGAPNLLSLLCTPTAGGGGCALKGTVNSTGASAWGAGSLTTPTSDGANMYLGHDNNALTKVPFTLATGGLGSAVDSSGVTLKVLAGSSVAIAGNLFFASSRVVDANNAGRYMSLLPALTANTNWTGAAGESTSANGAAIVTSPSIGNGYVLGSYDNTDGHLYGFSTTAGSSGTGGFVYPSGGGIGNLSAVAMGSINNLIYFSSDSPKQFAALSADGSTKLWSFTGNTINLSSVTTEPVLDSSGTAYFGDGAGNVFAIITDSGGPLAPVAGTNWPRVGYDNCNSGNSAFSCQ